MKNKNDFVFQEKGHKYFLDGKQLTGVTTIIGIADFGKSDSLIQWSANMAVDYIKDRLESGTGITGFDLDTARKAWACKRDKAGDIGTIVHGLVEAYVKSRIAKTEFNYDSELIKLISQSNGIILSEDEAKIRPMFDQFLEWEKKDDIKFLLSEQKLYSRELWFAGTVDLVFERKGKIYIGDLKTASNIYLPNFIQMAGYEIQLKELGKIKECAGYCVINIPKIINKEGKAFRRVKYIKGDTSDYIEAFKACEYLYRFNSKHKLK